MLKRKGSSPFIPKGDVAKSGKGAELWLLYAEVRILSSSGT